MVNIYFIFFFMAEMHWQLGAKGFCISTQPGPPNKGCPLYLCALASLRSDVGVLLQEFITLKCSGTVSQVSVEWKSIVRTRGSGDPSLGCICNAAGSDIRVIKFYSVCQSAIYIAQAILYTSGSAEPYLSQTEQWWHRSGFSSWQRSQ